MQGLLLLGFLVTGGALVWGLLQRKVAARAAASKVVLAPTALVSLGDSLAVGLSPHLAAWAASRGLPFIEDTKVGRFTRQQAVDRVPADALVFVSLGTNDATSSSGATALYAFHDALRARGPRAIVWLIPPATKKLPGLEAVRSVISQLGVLMVSTSAPMRSDGLHPSSYAAVFADVVPVLARAAG